MSRPSFSPQQKKACKVSRIHVIVLEKEVLDTVPTQRFFWDAVEDAYYRDWYYMGYGSVDDAATVWCRQIDRAPYPEPDPKR